MTSLDDVARRFRKEQLAQAGAAVGADDDEIDLDTLIAGRMNSAFADRADASGETARGGEIIPAEDDGADADHRASAEGGEVGADIPAALAPLDDRDAQTNEDERVDAAGPTSVASVADVDSGDPSREWVIPNPTARALGPKRRVVLDLSHRFDPFRLLAKERGLSSTNLVLAAFATHRDHVAAQAEMGAFRTLEPKGPVRAWQLYWHLPEIEAFDEFVDAVADHFERRSRAAVAAALLEACRRS